MEGLQSHKIAMQHYHSQALSIIQHRKTCKELRKDVFIMLCLTIVTLLPW